MKNKCVHEYRWHVNDQKEFCARCGADKPAAWRWREKIKPRLKWAKKILRMRAR